MANPSHNFTRASLIAIVPPEAGREYYRDERTRSLVLDVQASGLKTFRINRKFVGQPLKITLGAFDQTLTDTRDFPAGTDPLSVINKSARLNVRMARKVAEAVNASLDKGINPAQQARDARIAASQELTLRQAFDFYYEDHLVPYGRRTAEDLRNDFARYLGVVAQGQRKLRGREKMKSPGSVNWETRKLSSITPNDVRSMMNGIREKTGSRTANKALVLLRSIFNKMREHQRYLGDNPCAGIHKYAEESRERFLGADEIPIFLNALETETHRDFKDFIKLSLFTGIRRANVLAMRWQDIDLDGRVITIPSENSKNGMPLRIPMAPEAYEILRARHNELDKSIYVFQAKSASGHMSPPTKRWKALLKSAGIEDFRLHDLRRTLGSWAAMGGASLPIIGKMLGHQSGEATAIYARFQLDPVALEMASATAAIMSKARPTEALRPLPPTIDSTTPDPDDDTPNQ